MKIKLGIHYVVTKPSNDGEIQVGDKLLIKHNKKEPENGYFGYDNYVILTPVKETDNTWLFGMKKLNDCRHFDRKEDMLKAIEGVEAQPDKELATKLVSDLQRKIDKYKNDYQL